MEWLETRADHVPAEVLAARMLHRYGAAAVFGARGATVRELSGIDIARRVEAAWRGRAASTDWVTWGTANADALRLLLWAEKVHGDTYGENRD